MSEDIKKTENEILSQEADDEELSEVTGRGEFGFEDAVNFGDDENNCVHVSKRSIYSLDGSFPNCAATVEDGSWCAENDACFSDAVAYEGMKNCTKAHN